MIVLAALVLVPALLFMWMRLFLGAIVFGHRYFPMYLAFMAPWAYIFQHSPTMLTLTLLQMGFVTMWKGIRLLSGDYGHG